MKIRGVEQVDIKDYDELRKKIREAKSVKAINSLRMSCVELMKLYPEVLKMWQNKFYSLTVCPTCGRAK